MNSATTKRRPLTAEERLAKDNLRRIWEEKKGPLKLTQESAAHRFGWKNQSAAGQYLNGTIPLNTEAALRFAALLQVAPSDIDPRVQDLLPLGISEPSSAYDSSRYVFANKVNGPIIQSGTGGISWEHEEVDRSHAFQRDWINKKGLDITRCKIFKNHGDSNAPWLRAGDAVMVQLGDTAIRDTDDPTENVFALQYGEHSRFKRLVLQHDDSVLLRSFNPDKSLYPDERIAGDELSSLAIIGRVVWRGG